MHHNQEIFDALVRHMSGRKTWAGTSTELAKQMRLNMHPRALSAAINVMSPTLERAGITTRCKFTATARLRIIEKTSPSASVRMHKTAICPRCGHLFQTESLVLKEIHAYWEADVFCGRLPKDVKNIQNFCYKCAIDINARVMELGEIDSIRKEIDQLGGVIDERRTQDHRPTQDNARECGEGSNAGVTGYRSSYSAAQAGEEHHRLALQRNEDRDVPE